MNSPADSLPSRSAFKPPTSERTGEIALIAATDVHPPRCHSHQNKMGGLLGRPTQSKCFALTPGCPTLRVFRSVGFLPARPPMRVSQNRPEARNILPIDSFSHSGSPDLVLYVTHAEPPPSLLWRWLLPFRHDQLLSATAAARHSTCPRSLPSGSRAGSLPLSVRCGGICRHAGARALAIHRATTWRSVRCHESA